MAKDAHNEELMRWCIEQVVSIHSGAGLQIEVIQREAQVLFDFVDRAGNSAEIEKKA